MIIIHVKHYLNQTGINFFDKWFAECYSVMSKLDGFISLQRAFDNLNPDTVHIWVHFANREKVMAWAQTPKHETLILQLDPFRIKEWEATWYNTEIAQVEHHSFQLGEHVPPFA